VSIPPTLQLPKYLTDDRFQWAFLQIKQLLDLQRPRDLLARLGKLPKDLKLAYDEIYNRMEDHERKIADRAFQWVMCACKPLTTRELLPAICQDEYSDTLLPLDGLDEDLVLEYCHNLLIIDPVRQVWIPSHLSVIEYFENHLWSQGQANCLVSSVCLLVLQNTIFHNREKGWQRKELRLGCESSTEEESSTQGDSRNEESSSTQEDGTLPDDSNPTTINRPISTQRMEAYDPLDGQGFEILSFYARHHWPIHAKQSADKGNPHRLLTLLEEFLGQPTESSLAYRSWQRMVEKDGRSRTPRTSTFQSIRCSAADLSPNAIASFAYCAFDLAIVLPECKCLGGILVCY
jgi:ankyrin repeat domain-containing protein 50